MNRWYLLWVIILAFSVGRKLEQGAWNFMVLNIIATGAWAYLIIKDEY